jgi:antitoxin MazE
MQTEIKRWGNSAAVRLPTRILAAARLDENSAISMVVKGNKIIIEALKVPRLKHLKLPFSEASLIADLNPETSHADELALPSDKEWGD